MFELSPTYPSKTVGQLRVLFFKDHVYKEGIKLIASSPLGLVLNPPQLVNDKDPFATEMWIAVYHHLRRVSHKSWFYVIVERNDHNPYSGPHPAKLYLQVYPGKPGMWPARSVWLGTAQFEGSFYDEERIRIQLKRSIRLRQYYASPESEEEVIELDEYRPPTHGAQ